MPTTVAIIIPLYRPKQRHLLLIKSVLSACRAIPSVVIHAAADGPASEVTWDAESIDQLLTFAGAVGHQLRIYSYVSSAGYPGCYRRLLQDVLVDEGVELIHFVDQDDYCLPTRFVERKSNLVQASSTIVVDEQLTTLTTRLFDSEKLIALLETPSPGMTFSVPRSIAEKYLDLCGMTPLAAASPHDYVMAQLAHREDALAAAPGPSMLYIQHPDNTIGYVRGLRWVFMKLRTLRAVIDRTRRHAALLDLLYDGRGWVSLHSLHRNRARSMLYWLILKFS